MGPSYGKKAPNIDNIYCDFPVGWGRAPTHATPPPPCGRS